MKSLKELQEALLAMILDPVECENSLEALIKESDQIGVLSKKERLSIYGEAFYARLHQIMEVEYPALHHALEDDLFHHFVSDYLKKYPPSSYTLIDLGMSFPGFLRETRPDNNDEQWPEFIIELATLERAFQEVFNSNGSDETIKECDDSFEKILNEENSILLECVFPVHEYFLAYRESKKAVDIPDPNRVSVLIYRRNFQVRILSRYCNLE